MKNITGKLPDEHDRLIFALELLNHPERMADWQVQCWMQDPINKALIEELRVYVEVGFYATNYETPDVTIACRSFLASMHRKESRAKVWRALIAASVVLLVGSVSFLYKMQISDSTSNVILTTMDSITSGTNRATLQTDAGTTIVLGDQELKNIEVSGGVVLDYDTLQGIHYKIDEEAPIAYHLLTTPQGGEYTMTLSDGTKVWLNSGSQLRYPTQFSPKVRNVELKGEAYFQVNHVDSIPFVVKVDSIETRVYGTEFNIRAYNIRSVDITLVKGAVSVAIPTLKEIALKPGENAHFSENNPPLVEKVNTHHFTAWHEGYFYFENKSLEVIMNDLERWYDVETIYIGDTVRDLHFELWIERDSNLQDIVTLLTQTNKIDINIQGRRLIISQQY